ncbi:Ankyrin repeat domain-containing protein 44 [Phytophthora pseudosyringae]|uniref:Ankyrin repeat domain-containing protein 44 n=1 Tax=Phytophthora pseudosyringae TaxID=221518 RepID=A0A8T1VXH8_9STRA|nr:Ankyrin repeat domain-containing protein 44 [Phytophthora pseudosyringae]
MEKDEPDPSQKEVLAKEALQAIRNGNGDELKKLLVAGADPDGASTIGIKNEATNTLLYHAVAKQDVASVNVLFDHGADVNGFKAEGFPPLRAAVVRNNAALIKLLLARGADLNHRYTIVTGNRKETKTVLFETATSLTYELLLKSGADVHVKNSWHETPLHFQAYNWNSRLVRALVSSGADVNAVNKKSTTPLDNAIFRKPSQRKSDDEEFLEVCRILLRNKAVVPWSDPDQYFQSKGKEDSDSGTIKARLRLVHEWASQRKKGNTSFKLPIEVFRRGALDIATYYTALNRGGRRRDSVVRKPDAESVVEEIGGNGGDCDSQVDSAFSRAANADLDSTKVIDAASSVVSQEANASRSVTLVERVHKSKVRLEPRVIGGGKCSPPAASQTIRGDLQSTEAVKNCTMTSGNAPKNKRSRGKVVKEGNNSAQTPPKRTIRGGSPPSKVVTRSERAAGSTTSDDREFLDLPPETSPVCAHRVLGVGCATLEQQVKPEDSGDGCDNPKTNPMSATRVIARGTCQSSVSPTADKNEATSPESEKLLYRCKVCVVGPSRWGKTSFIKSFTSGAPTLESIDVRTVGIDLFPWSFDLETDAGDCEYQVSFWDFAGQEEYRAAHTLFYSSRTLYLLCINLDRYHKALLAATDSMDQTVDDRMMDAFAETHIFRWVRMICAHHPQVEFVFLGTKADLIQHDRRKIRSVQQDIVARFKSNVRGMRDRVQRALQELEDARFEIQDSDPGAERPIWMIKSQAANRFFANNPPSYPKNCLSSQVPI